LNTRVIAVKALIEILEKDKQASDVLNSYNLEFFGEFYSLVSGTIKSKISLDYIIEKISNKEIKNIAVQIRNILRLALYEIKYLKTPEYAVLNSYVEIAKKNGKKQAGFVNAILRKYLREKDLIEYPDAVKNPASALSIKYSHPQWMIKRWIKIYGIDETEKICEFNNLPPELTIRINTIKINKEKLIEIFKKNKIDFSDPPPYKNCLIINHQGKITELPGYNEGYWLVQSIPSSLVSEVLDPQENENILDVCAAPGSKTAHIAALMNDKGHITALDISSDRIEKITENCVRLGINCVETIRSDATEFSTTGLFDRVLVDAPCSNTGVLSRRIDARYKKTPKEIKNLAELQYNILLNVSKFVKEGGILVYSTCSIEPEENEILIKRFVKENKHFKFDMILPYLPWTKQKDEGYFQILPSMHQTDGFFIARLQRLSE
jgi:16S rRNA (cytosine967-C5)-methyltransferase